MPEQKKVNPYMKFVQKQRQQVIQQNPKLKFTEVGKKLGEMWRQMSDAEKQKYR
jgi:hypothetical protein